MSLTWNDVFRRNKNKNRNITNSPTPRNQNVNLPTYTAAQPPPLDVGQGGFPS